MTKPTFQLAMICRNSSETIVQCLESYKPVISYWTILDTGSTDGTQELIKQTLKGIPGKLHEHPFEGFSASRNRCLDLLGQHASYTIMPDDSYVLQNPQALIDELTDTRYPVVGIRITKQHTTIKHSYSSKRISLASCGIRYFGEIHEDLSYGINYTLKDAYLLDLQGGPLQKARTKDRLTSDLAILSRHSDPRSVYYMAMTYLNLGQPEDAKRMLLKRLDLQKDPKYQTIDYEERFQAMFHLSTLTKDVNWYYRAAQEYPPRAGEAWFHVYLHSGRLEDISQAYKHRRLDLNKCRLPLMDEVYSTYIPAYFAEELNRANIFLYVIIPLFNVQTGEQMRQVRSTITILLQIPYVRPVLVSDSNYFPANDLGASVGSESVIYIVRHSSQRCLWLKENLVNLAIRELIEKQESKYFCWMDADVSIAKDSAKDFAKEVLARLITPQSIAFQPWRVVEENHHNTSRSYCYSVPKGHTGHCWAINRKAFEQLNGLYDKLVTGSFDYYLAHKAEFFVSFYSTLPEFIKEDLDKYDQLLKEVTILQGEDIPEVAIEHNPLGSITNRKYNSRHKMISNLQKDNLSYNEQGVLVINDSELISQLQTYYRNRVS